MLGSKPQYTTENPDRGESFSLGEAKPEHSGFASNQLPNASDLWKQYYDNVLRGNESGEQMTFSAADLTNRKPPHIDEQRIDGNPQNGKGGIPFGGMMPTIASPGEGNGTNPSALPLIPPTVEKTGNNGEFGSRMAPLAGSLKQVGQSNGGAGPHPSYKMVGTNKVLAAWSD